jgi:starch phosphorylase
MAYLAIVGSHKVNGVAELHSDLIKTTIFKDFVKIFGPDKFTNVTNGITPRRWLHQANPRLSELIASKTGGLGFLKDLNILNDLEKYADDKEFKKEWAEIKYANKVRLAKHIKSTTGVTVNPSALFDIQVKRIHEYKRQQMNIFGVIHRYLTIKAMTPEERKKLAPRVSIFGGKAAPGYWMAKTIIHLINNVGAVVNKDPDIGDLLKVIFLEDYNVSKAEIIIPASDISEHISTAGTEASGTSNMKFVLNGGLIIGTCDGANVSPVHLGVRSPSDRYRLKSLVKSERTTSSSSVTSPKTLKISATPIPTVHRLSIPISPKSLKKSGRAPLVTQVPSPL